MISTQSDALKVALPLIAILLFLCLFLLPINPLIILSVLAFVSAAFAATKIKDGRIFFLFVIFIYFEGMVKIVTTYNVVARVGLDLFLIFVFLRLYKRMHFLEDNQFEAFERKHVKSVVPFIILFWLWVAVQFFNPWGIGIVPSIAALKVYVTPIMVFFITGYFLTDEELRKLPFLILILGTFEAIVTTIDGYIGFSGVPSLHPQYIWALHNKFVGVLYRPYGTTALPGMPGSYIFNSALAVFFILYHLGTKTHQVKRLLFWRIMLAAFFIFGSTAVFYSQVRTVAIKYLVLAFFSFGMLNYKSLISATVVVAGLASYVHYLVDTYADIDIKRASEDDIRMHLMVERFLTLRDVTTLTEARGGALDMMILLAKSTVLGIGLSRTGSASAPWQAEIRAAPHFSEGHWAFSDNLYRAIFQEIGIFGLIVFLLLFAAIIFKLLKIRSKYSAITAVFCCLYLFAGFGSEGVLYAPDSHFLWLYVALALRNPFDRKLSTAGKEQQELKTTA